jgi:cysteine-rich repeat protein
MIESRAFVLCWAVGLAACQAPKAEAPHEDCAVPGDEDGNGLADCADPACAAACPAVCGNGVVEAGEACDDGNLAEGDGCDPRCQVTACGDGVVSAGELCDDGNLVDGDGCEACELAVCASGAPVEVGAGGSLPLAGPVARIVTSPASCFVYALSLGAPAQLVMVSAVDKQELARLQLPGAQDIALSPDGAYLVAAEPGASQLTVVDPTRLRVARTIPTAAPPSVVRVDNAGIAYYVKILSLETPGLTETHRVDLQSGVDTLVATLYGADIALSDDGQFLYAGESGLSGDNLFKYAVSAAGATVVDRSTYNDHYGFETNKRHTYLSPGGQHIYYADYQLDAHALGFATGRTGELIYAEDAAGRFAIGEHHVFDAALVRPIADLPHGATAAVLTAGDRELWYYGAPGRLYYVNTAELVGAGLGVHEVAPAPLATYHLAKLVHDPVRPRLYGVDTAQAVVVVIDTRTLQPTRAIRVSTTPTDLAIDAAGTTLFVGHQDVQGFARIALDDLTFDHYVVAPRVTYQIAAVRGGRVVTIDWYQGTTPSLLDAATGAVLSEGGASYFGALSATADGATIFVGDGGSSGGNVTRYSVATDTMIDAGHTRDGEYFPTRSITALPDGSGVYYADVLLDGADLEVERYALHQPIVAVSPDGRRALSATTVYDVATGRALGLLPATTSALAISPDSKRAFLFTGSEIVAADLSAY